MHDGNTNRLALLYADHKCLLRQLASFGVHHGYGLLSCVQITAYNFHLGLLRPEPFGWIPQSLLGSSRPRRRRAQIPRYYANYQIKLTLSGDRYAGYTSKRLRDTCSTTEVEQASSCGVADEEIFQPFRERSVDYSVTLFQREGVNGPTPCPTSPGPCKFANAAPSSFNGYSGDITPSVQQKPKIPLRFRPIIPAGHSAFGQNTHL